ncbi:MAG: 3-deoxy-manno-octulosonate cytidylyltransferase [Pseudomonadota bacterium]
MTNDFIVVIPARYASSRLPGKVLMPLQGKALLQHVYERSLQSSAKRIIIATDDAKVMHAAKTFAAEVYLTSPHHSSGTERIAELIKQLNFADDEIIVNVQADKPLVSPKNINQVASDLMQTNQAEVATLAVELHDEKRIFDPNQVKVVLDEAGYALYFSRAPIPYLRAKTNVANQTIKTAYLGHLGLYAYTSRAILDYIQLSPSPLEAIESLEQLRLLWHQRKIHVAMAVDTFDPSVDTQADYDKLTEYLQQF